MSIRPSCLLNSCCVILLARVCLDRGSFGCLALVAGVEAACVAAVEQSQLLKALLSVVCHELWQAEQVVGSTAEDEDPVDLGPDLAASLGERSGLLQPAEGLPDQPAAAQAQGVAGMPGGSSVEDRAASLFLLLHMRGDVEGTGSGDDVPRVIRLIGTYGDASRARLLPIHRASGERRHVQHGPPPG